MKTIAGLGLLLVFGIAVITEGIIELFGPVTCAGRVLSPNDTCLAGVSKGRSAELDYETFATRIRIQGAIEIGIGLLLVLLPVLVLVAWLRRRRNRPSGPDRPGWNAPAAVSPAGPPPLGWAAPHPSAPGAGATPPRPPARGWAPPPPWSAGPGGDRP